MDREEEYLQHLAALGRWAGRREQGVDEDLPKGPEGPLDPGLLRLAFKTLRKAGHDPLHDPDGAKLIELLVPIYTALTEQQPTGRPIGRLTTPFST